MGTSRTNNSGYDKFAFETCFIRILYFSVLADIQLKILTMKNKITNMKEKKIHIFINGNDEYYYSFNNRPMSNRDKLIIAVSDVDEAFDYVQRKNK